MSNDVTPANMAAPRSACCTWGWPLPKPCVSALLGAKQELSEGPFVTGACMCVLVFFFVMCALFRGNKMAGKWTQFPKRPIG